MSEDFGDIFGDILNNMGMNINGMGFGGLQQIRFLIVNTNPNKPVIITENTEVSVSPKAVGVAEEKIIDITYEDIGGLSEEVTKVREMIELPLKHPEIFERLGVEPPRGILLYGPPGTGKTWLAKRLAYALMGQRDEGRVRAVQFHPNLSYEDFVRGWRPSGDGKLALVDGPFLQMIRTASQEPEMKSVLVIEEINRGHPAQIFGEMLTLLEADKRTPSEALELCYRREPGERVFIPGNLYVIGTMNIADRSLALVDLALRRRFAFVDLEPRLGRVWRDWVSRSYGIDGAFLDEIERRILTLNEQIAADSSLGRQFRIGHSYVTPPVGSQITDARRWFIHVVATEIGPLLDEYWFDAEEKAQEARRRLAEGL